MALTKLIGRCIIAVALFVAAYVHLTDAAHYLPYYTKSYGLTHSLASTNQLTGLPTPTEVSILSIQAAKYWLAVIKIVGVLQGAMGILILFSDSMGYLLQFFALLITAFFTHYEHADFSPLAAGNFGAVHTELVWLPINLGLAFVFLSTRNQQAQFEKAKRAKTL